MMPIFSVLVYSPLFISHFNMLILCAKCKKYVQCYIYTAKNTLLCDYLVVTGTLFTNV